MKPTIEQIVTSNVEMATDQRHDYDIQSDETCHWYEGDAFLQNTVDSIREEGYNTDNDWENATGLFWKLAEKAGLRFAS